MSDQLNKQIKFATDARQEIIAGIDLLANTVKTTLGPRGRNVVIERKGDHPLVTKDGVTVAKSINLRDSFKDLGVQLVKEASSRTNDVAGDGTTTATVLAQALVKEGNKLVTAGYSPDTIKKEMEEALVDILEYLEDMALPVETIDDIENVGTVSANGDESIGRLLSQALDKVGKYGVVYVDEARGFKTELETVEGFKFNRGFITPYFVSDKTKMRIVMDNPRVLVVSKKITSINEIVTVLEEVARASKPLLIIADDVDGDALQGLILNKLRGTIDVCAVRSPGVGDFKLDLLDDVSVFSNAEVCISSEDLSNHKCLGKLKKVIIDKASTTLVCHNSAKLNIEQRLIQLKQKLENENLNDEDYSKTKDRIAKLTGKVAVLRIGAPTQVELAEKKDRVDDALHATRAAVEAGILPGGGCALLWAKHMILSDKSMKYKFNNLGYAAFLRAIEAPFRQILENADIEPAKILARLKFSKDNAGYDVRNEKYCDMIASGIVDPHKVCRSALENAMSVAGMVLTVDSAIVEDTI